ncbi:MAG: EVE domain-containing protein, partial [Woeseiaceae bacterium]|nr:EVE domain-containing protein [Woeseiaceae bacterium]
FDPDSKYCDPKSDPDEPRWILVDIAFVRKLKRPIPLAALKSNPALEDMILLRRGNRLSIMPVSDEHWDAVIAMT